MKRALKVDFSPRATRTLGSLRTCLVLASIAFPLSAATAETERATEARPAAAADATTTQVAERVLRLKQTREQFLAAASAPLPEGLSAEQRVEAKRYMVWLRVCAAHMEELAAKADGGGRQAQLLDATRAMEATQEAFNRQYLQLHDSMQTENMQYAAASTVLTSTHDSVKNSISNLR